MPTKVTYHKDFYYGTEDNCYFKDFGKLDGYAKSFLSFVKAIQTGNQLEGKNVNSWIDPNIGTVINKHKKLFHYHTGNTYNNNYSYSLIQTQNIRIENEQGKTSKAVVHYKWYNEDKTELVIIAFSPEHNPFNKLSSVLVSRGGGLFKPSDRILLKTNP